MRPTRWLTTLLLSVTLLPLPALAETAEQIEQAERWFNDLSKELLEKGAVSETYITNYIQCLRDQQALRENPNAGLSELLDQLKGTGESCNPVISEMLEALQDEQEAQQQQRDLDKSL